MCSIKPQQLTCRFGRSCHSYVGLKHQTKNKQKKSFTLVTHENFTMGMRCIVVIKIKNIKKEKESCYRLYVNEVVNKI